MPSGSKRRNSAMSTKWVTVRQERKFTARIKTEDDTCKWSFLIEQKQKEKHHDHNNHSILRRQQHVEQLDGTIGPPFTAQSALSALNAFRLFHFFGRILISMIHVAAVIVLLTFASADLVPSFIHAAINHPNDR